MVNDSWGTFYVKFDLNTLELVDIKSLRDGIYYYMRAYYHPITDKAHLIYNEQIMQYPYDSEVCVSFAAKAASVNDLTSRL